MRNRFALIAALVSATVLTAGCSTGAAKPTPSPEPREAVVSALESTAGLHSVHVVLEVKIDSQGQGSVAYDFVIVGDVDVAARELDMTATLSPELFGTKTARVVVADGVVASSTDGASWNISGSSGRDPLQGVPTTAAVSTAIIGAVRDPATRITAEGIEACGEKSCFRIRAEVPREVGWRAVSEMIASATQSPPAAQPIPREFPDIAIELWIEQDTLQLHQATNTTVVNGQSIAISVVLTNHDRPVVIALPEAARPTPGG